MNFYAFEYEKNIDFDSIIFEDDKYTQTIKDGRFFLIHKKLYGHNYPDDWNDKQKKETLTGVGGELEQLMEQIFVLIDYREKHIYSNLDSVNKTRNVIFEIIRIKLLMFQRLVSIEDFETKISKLTGICIKTQSLKQKVLFANDILNVDSQMLDLSEAENFRLEINYNLSKRKSKIVKMYRTLVDTYNVGEVTFKGSNDENIFQFNTKSIIQKVPVKLSKNGEGNIFDYKEVFKHLTLKL